MLPRKNRLPPWGTLRLATERDAAGVAALYAPYVQDTAISFEYTPPDEAAMRRRIASTLETYPFLVWDEPDGIKGYAYASRFGVRAAYDWVAELSIYLRPELRGTGVAEALYRALMRLLREQGVWRVYAIITDATPASRRFHEKLGFQVYGQFPASGYKLGSWHDVLHMELALREGSGAPAPLLAIGDLPQGLIEQLLANRQQ
ncbi:MAG: N-acetyltransferase family protein [Angelakisella sp.]